MVAIIKRILRPLVREYPELLGEGASIKYVRVHVEEEGEIGPKEDIVREDM